MLKLRSNNKNNGAVWLVEPKVSLGFDSDCDMQLSDPKAAKHHADILVEQENIQFKLLVDSADTFINGKRIGKDKVYALTLEDEIRIGEELLKLVDPKQEPRRKLADPQEKTGWALKSNSAALSNRVYPLTTSAVVGRSSECDISLGAAHLSRRHASLQVKDGLLYVKDLGSSNGTYLNGKKITEARVKRGDELCFDTLSFGVIGPSDELDKTTVRSALSSAPSGDSGSVQSAAASRARSEGANNALPGKKVQSREAIKKKLEQQQVTIRKQVEADAVEAQESAGKKALLGLFVVAALVIGFWFLQK
jgi:pSer/pThr/pTyr-binding forkhead associated (FHA) protein